MMQFGRLFSLCALIGLAAAVARADDDGKDLRTCQGRGETFLAPVTVRDAIISCTRLIRSERYQGDALVLFHLQRSAAYLQSGDTDEAIEDLDKAVALKPSAMTHSARGDAYRQKHNVELALADYNAAIALDPNDPKLLQTRGYIYYFAKDYDHAIADFTQAIKLDANVHRYSARGDAYQAKGELDKALADYTTAHKLSPDATSARGNICVISFKLGQAEALEWCNEAIAKAPTGFGLYATRGFVHYRLGHAPEAAADFEESLRRDKKFAPALFGRGLAKIKSGDVEGGNKDIDKAKEVAPDIEATYAKYGVTRP